MDFSYKALFIDLGSDRVILLEFGFFGLDQSVELQDDFPVTESIFLCGHLIKGQLLVSIDFVYAVCPGGCLPVRYDDGPRFVLFDEIRCPDNGQLADPLY